MENMLSFSGFDLTLLTLLGLVGVALFAIARRSRRPHTTQLHGPPRDSFLFGQRRLLRAAKDAAAVLEEWSTTYGGAFNLPSAFGGSSIVITDPKAIAHLFSNLEVTYHHTSLSKAAIEKLVGKNILWADGETHKRQRKAISPSFSSVMIREYTPIFNDAAYKLVHKWESLFSHQIETEGLFVTDVQHWLNAISLDSIGIAGFSHDFGALAGKRGDVITSFEKLAEGKFNVFDVLILMFGDALPVLNNMPTGRQNAIKRMNKACGVLARNLLAQTRAEKEAEEGDRSIMGLLIKAERTSGLTLREDEVIAQMKGLMVAGYESTSASMTWALIELCKHQEIQSDLRDELIKAFPTSDPSYEDLVSQTTLPLLDAVAHETLRLHPAINETWRGAIHDDVLPLSEPIRLPNGVSTDRISVGKGQAIMVPVAAVNRSCVLWGEDAKQFRPQRWIDGVSGKAQEILAYRHILTFIDGPKTCLGKNFALLEMKVVLAVLIRKYSFEMLDGPETKIGEVLTIILRPKVEGRPGTQIPMRIRRVE